MTAVFRQSPGTEIRLGPNYVPLGPSGQGLAFGKGWNKGACRGALTRLILRGSVNYNSKMVGLGSSADAPVYLLTGNLQGSFKNRAFGNAKAPSAGAHEFSTASLDAFCKLRAYQ